MTSNELKISGTNKVGSKGGFTLLELLVVIGLIGILMALLLPAILKSKDNGAKKRIEVGALALKTAINNYRSTYHKWPAKTSDLEAGKDVTYGADGRDNVEVIKKLKHPPDGSSGNDEPLIDESDFIFDSAGNVLKTAKGEQYKITLDIDGSYELELDESKETTKQLRKHLGLDKPVNKLPPIVYEVVVW